MGKSGYSHFFADDIPASVGIVLDTSSSMRSAIAEARTAALSFLRESNQDDEHFLVEFNERPTIVEDFTTDIHRLEDRVVSAQVTGSTALYDPIELALENLAHASRSRKALVLISDGENN